ncbi:MAG TPA: two-component regulator propeller domain-containing protein [Vicinamibacterales bacterium]|nr:two-component regulator propeller domain-containing protein [Vicinamibacterales bacterium]
MNSTQPAGRSARALAVLPLSAVLLSCPPALALNPSLELQQYGHSSQLLGAGFVRGIIRAITQTPDGYLWLGTDLGVFRFDGVRAVAWTPPLGDRLPSSLVTALVAGRDGTLWIGTSQGLVSWNGGRLTHHTALSNMHITALLEDRSGTIWAGTTATGPAKLCAFQIANAKCFGEDGTLGEFVWSLAEDRAGNVWVGARTGLWRWAPGPPSRYTSEPIVSSRILLTPTSGVAGVTVVLSGRVRDIGPEGRSGEAVRGLPSTSSVRILFRDHEGALWIGTSAHGVARVYDGKVSVFTHVNGLSGNQVNAFFEDREGTMWIATADGLDSFRQLRVVPMTLAGGSLRTPNPVSIVAARDGSVWIGSDDGLHRWRDGRVTIYRTRTHPELPDDAIQSLADDERGRIWVTAAGRLAFFHNGRFTSVPAPHLGPVYAIAGDGRGGVWVSSFDQGVVHVVGGKVVERMSFQEGGGGMGGSGLVPDSNGGVWIALIRGALVHFRGGRILERLTPRDGLGEGYLVNLQRDSTGALWASTDGGFSRIVDGRIATMTIANGLPCNQGQWIIEDDAASYWLYLRCGLVRIARSDMQAWAANPQRSVQATTFDRTDGVRLSGVNKLERPMVAKSSDGKLWMIYPGMLGLIDPANLPRNAIPPPVHVEQITADGTTFEAAPRLRLPPKVRDLRIDYTALSLAAPEKVRFRFRLEGQNADWTDVINQRTVHYSNLAPGDYRFHVAAANNNGVWNEQGDVLEFSIAPAYYQTNAFRVLCVVVLTGIFWTVWQLRIQQLARQLDLTLDARVAERTRIARELHDTLLQSFQGLLLKFQSVLRMLPERPIEARQRLERALDQATDTTTQARDALQGLRSAVLEKNDLVEAIRNVGTELAAESPATTSIEVNGQGARRALRPIVQLEVYRIAVEALRNAFQHAHAGRVRVEVRFDERQFRLGVTDDGRGIDERVIHREPPERHFGLQGMRERAEGVGGHLDIWTKRDTGTQLDLSIPASAAYGGVPRRSSWFRLPFRIHAARDDRRDI